MTEPWHALLAPVPLDVVPRRGPVASPEILAGPGGAIAGWEQLVFEMSAGAAGLRVVLIVLDATGRPISASDTVLYRSDEADSCQESLGGRFTPDGSFEGTVDHGRAGKSGERRAAMAVDPEKADRGGSAAVDGPRGRPGSPPGTVIPHELAQR